MMSGEDHPPQNIAGGEITYFCPKCNDFLQSADEIGFCTQCGTTIIKIRGGTKRVLLVDDSMIARKKIGAILRALGCKVLEAEDGLEGVERAKNEVPDVIVLDIQMPRQDGLTALREIRQDRRFKSTPIIMMTVEADATMVSKAVFYQATDYIRKDTSVSEIMKRLRKHISG